jgi:putative ABC transport system permease protein
VSVATARAALEVIGVELNRAYPDELGGLGITAVRARDYFEGEDDRLAVALMAAVALLFLIGGTNVAVLLTTKFASRSDEVAVRAALGCSRARQVRQFVTEGLLVFVAGGAAGLLLAAWLKDLLVVFLPEAIATQVGFDGIPLDLPMVTFATAVSVASGLGFGLIAARRVSITNPGATMKAGGRAVAGSSVRGLLGRLVIAEVALAIVLLAAAATMVDTFRRLQSRDLGFEPDGVLTLQFDFNANRYGSPEARRLLLDRVLERLRTLPGVASAGATTVNPVCCGNWGMRVTPEGHPPVPAGRSPTVQHFIVAPGYFETMGQRVIEGRAFRETDVDGAEMTVVVDRTAAARFWPGQSALGKRIKRGALDSAYSWLTVVGVVENVIDEGDYPDAWYLPFAQHATGPSATGAHLMVRGEGDAAALTAAIRRAVAGIDPDLALYEIATMTALVSDNLRQGRLGALVGSLFAGAGLLLACLGLYGVLSFAVNADRRDIGVRLALGAPRHDVLRVVIRRGVGWTAIGALIGSAAAYGVCVWLTRIVTDARFNPRSIGLAVAMLCLAAILAMLVPTRRALRVDPLTSLRMD